LKLKLNMHSAFEKKTQQAHGETKKKKISLGDKLDQLK